MPKIAHYTLVWSPLHQAYELRASQENGIRYAVLFPAEHAMGPDDGLCYVDHIADASALSGLPESLHHQYHFQRSQRLVAVDRSEIRIVT